MASQDVQDASAPIRELTQIYGPNYRYFVTATVLVGTIGTGLTSMVVNVAIPSIMGTFGISQDEAQWLATGFLAATTTTMLLNAWAVRAFGMRTVFIASLTVFLAASVVASLAPNEDVLIGARIVQGATSGFQQPLSMQIIFQVYPFHQRGRAMGLFSLGTFLAPSFGPFVGGMIIDGVGWRSIFLAGVPLAAVALPLALMFLPRREEEGRLPDFDWIGVGLVCVFITTFLTGLTEGRREGWDAVHVSGLLSTAGLSGVLFVFWETRVEHPILDLRLFTNMKYTASVSVIFVFGLGFQGTLYLTPLFAQTIAGFSPTEAGLLMLPPALLAAFMNPVSGYLSDYVAARTMIFVGMVLFGISLTLMGTFDAGTPFWLMVQLMMVGRFGFGFMGPSLNASALKALEPHEIGAGTGTMSFMRSLGGAMGTNFIAIYLEHNAAYYNDLLKATQTATNVESLSVLQILQERLALLGVSENLQMPGALGFLSQIVDAQARTFAFQDCFQTLGIVFFLALVPAFFVESKGRPMRGGD